MATPVSWSYGPWRTQQTSTEPNPYQGVPTSAPEAIPQTPPGPFDQGEGGGRGGPGITGTAEYGPMTARELGNMWGGLAARKGISALGGYALSGAVPGVSSLMSAAPYAGVTVASLMSSLFGGIRGTDDQFGIPSETDIRDIQDYNGVMDAQNAARNAEAKRESVRSTLNDISGVRQPGYAPDAPGIGGPSPGEAPTGNPETGDYAGLGMGGPGGTGDGNESGGPSGGFGGDSMGDSGGYGGGGGTDSWAKGGVSRVTRPTRALYGEGGEPETAVFIPEHMKRPGQQGNEPQVEQVMRQLLRALRR